MAADYKPYEKPFGRPTVYDPSYCEHVVILGAQGMSKVEIAHMIGVDRATLNDWARKYEDFSRALTRAKEAEQIWWEKKGRENLESQVFQASMWSRSMAARFPADWRETSRQEQTGADGAPIEVKVVTGVTRDDSSND